MGDTILSAHSAGSWVLLALLIVLVPGCCSFYYVGVACAVLLHEIERACGWSCPEDECMKQVCYREKIEQAQQLTQTRQSPTRRRDTKLRGKHNQRKLK